MGGDPSLWGRDGVEGMTMPTGIASTKNETKDPANMKRKREKARQKHEKKGTKNGERPPGPKPHKAEQGEDGGTMRR